MTLWVEESGGEVERGQNKYGKWEGVPKASSSALQHSAGPR